MHGSFSGKDVDLRIYFYKFLLENLFCSVNNKASFFPLLEEFGFVFYPETLISIQVLPLEFQFW